MHLQLAAATLQGEPLMTINHDLLISDLVPVCQLTLLMFLDTLCSKKLQWGVVYSCVSRPQFPILLDIRLVTINLHACRSL